MYMLGLGIGDYLGIRIDWRAALLGLGWVLALQWAVHFLSAYFERLSSAEYQNDARRTAREWPLWVAMTALTLLALFTLAMMRGGYLSGMILIPMALLLMGAMAAVLPPLRLEDSLYRALLPSILIPGLVPLLAFMLQGESPHRLVSMSAFPLILLHYGAVLLYEFPHFADDLKYQRRRLLVRIGWRNGMNLINLSMLSAFVLLGGIMLLGFPGEIAWPVFLVLPLVLFLIWYLTRIGEGARPHWKALLWMASAAYGMAAYLLAFTFWTR